MSKAALLGIGVVGSGVAELLRDNKEKISAIVGEDIELKYILASRPHPESPFAQLIIQDFSLIENDPEISVVAECIGGVGAAYDYVRRALEAGKSVVTSNKELIAEKGLELIALAKSKKLKLLFEGAVGGGIPIIRPLSQCLAGNRIEEIYGVLNGTTNYILTQMRQCEKTYKAALKEAQKLGYAEADPSADVDGTDACRKVSILADICFGRNIAPKLVPTKGIRAVSTADISAAGGLGFNIKLVGRAVRVGEKLAVYVEPHLIPKKNMLYNVSGVMNGVVVKGNAVGECFFYGPGAGKLPTGSAVVADIMDAVRRQGERGYISWNECSDENLLLDMDELETGWFLRCDRDCEASYAWFGIGDDCTTITRPMSRKTLMELCKNVKVRAAYRVL